MLCGQLVDPQSAYVHAHGARRRRLSPYEPLGEIFSRGIPISAVKCHTVSFDLPRRSGVVAAVVQPQGKRARPHTLGEKMQQKTFG